MSIACSGTRLMLFIHKGLRNRKLALFNDVYRERKGLESVHSLVVFRGTEKKTCVIVRTNLGQNEVRVDSYRKLTEDSKKKLPQV